MSSLCYLSFPHLSPTIPVIGSLTATKVGAVAAMDLSHKPKTMEAATRRQAAAVGIETSCSRSNAWKLVRKRRFTCGNLSLVTSRIRKAIVMEMRAGRNTCRGTSNPAIGRDRPPEICHSRRGSSFILLPNPPEDLGVRPF